VIACQALAHPSNGPLAIHLLSLNRSPDYVIESLSKVNGTADRSQISILAFDGQVSTFTGSKCIPEAGHCIGKNVSCQGNMLSNDSIWTAMVDAFDTSSGLGFAERLAFSLQAGHRAGGDIRGIQSSAIQIYSGRVHADPWLGRLLDLRVEDHPSAINELQRLIKLRRAYDLSDMGEELLLLKKKPFEASEAYENAMKLAPEIQELRYWAAIAFLNTKKAERGISELKLLFKDNPMWLSLTRKLIMTGHVPDNQHLLKKLGIDPK